MSKEKKLVVLEQLEKEKEPISIGNLLQKLGQGYVERTVRRWLSLWVEEGIVEALGDKGRRTYWLKSIAKLSTKKESICFSAKSLKILQQIKRPLAQRHPTTYAEKWLEAYKPNVTFYLPSNIQKELKNVGKRSSNEEPAGTFAHKIYNRLLIDLSYNSSRLEGNTYSLLDTKKLILEGEGAEGKLDEEKIMILNHKEAIRYLVDHAHDLDVSRQTICKLHYLLADGLIENPYAGNVRDHGVHIGGSTYIPFENQRKLEDLLDQISEKAAQIHDPYEQSFFLLVHITYLQAFLDVNKRTARLASNIPLIQGNFAPLSFNDVEKDDYISAMLTIYELQDVRPLVDLYVFSYLRSSAVYDSTINAIALNEIRVRYRQQRRALIRDIILKGLIGSEMKEYITSQTSQLIPEKDQTRFLDEVYIDLKELNETRIVGLGITPQELESWLNKSVNGQNLQ